MRERLRREFAAGEDWGWKSFLAEQPVFFDSHSSKQLTTLDNKQIFVALVWKDFYARQCGKVPFFYADEMKIWKKHFQVALMALGFLLFTLWCNYFGDADHDGIPDLIERIIPMAFFSK